jgi:hypothetical protein
LFVWIRNILPEEPHSIFLEFLVLAHDRQSLCSGLGYDNSIKWITMMQGHFTQFDETLQFDAEYTDLLLLKLRRNDLFIGASELQLAQPCLDYDLPETANIQKQIIVAIPYQPSSLITQLITPADEPKEAMSVK